MDADPRLAAGRSWTVAAFIEVVAGILEHELSACTVQGEIGGLSRAGSGHRYFTLKDADGAASLRCALFRRAGMLLDFAPADGQRVEVRGRVAVYPARGELQFIVEAMRPAGAGALYERFLRLRARLEGEGLFAAEAKRPLPVFPRRVGLVTSLQGAALHDVATTLARRSPHVSVVVYPSPVQGADAPEALCRAIAAANTRREVDVLIVCRGGGSLEDLWAFNEESVVRAIRAAAMPVVCGVGHETDVTLADLAADLRAPTPTSAAEMAVPASLDHLQRLAVLESSRRQRMANALDARGQRLDHVALRLARPGEGMRAHAQRLAFLAHRWSTAATRPIAVGRGACDRLEGDLRQAGRLAVEKARGRLEHAAARLQALDPTRVLERGYALLTDADGQAITSAQGLVVGEPVRARLRDGEASLVPSAIEVNRVG